MPDVPAMAQASDLIIVGRASQTHLRQCDLQVIDGQ